MSILICQLFVMLALFQASYSRNTCPSKNELSVSISQEELLYFTHIPKAGGRVLSYWLGTTYGVNHLARSSRTANIFDFRTPKYGEVKAQNDAIERPPEALQVAYSHNRPDLAIKMLQTRESIEQPVRVITMLREVHEHRESMVNKYVKLGLNKALNGGAFLPKGKRYEKFRVKNFNKPLRNATYKNWVHIYQYLSLSLSLSIYIISSAHITTSVHHFIYLINIHIYIYTSRLYKTKQITRFI